VESLIRVKVDISDAVKGLNFTKKQLNAVIKDTLKVGGEGAKRFAQSIAPKGRTGNLSRGIYATSTSKQLKVVSAVPGSFPYNRWVNQSPGFEKLGPYKKSVPSLGIKKGDILIYGRQPKRWNYSQAGVKYMYKTAKLLERDIPKMLRSKMKKISG
jgi:hypothetical protein